MLKTSALCGRHKKRFILTINSKSVSNLVALRAHNVRKRVTNQTMQQFSLSNMTKTDTNKSTKRVKDVILHNMKCFNTFPEFCLLSFV